MSNTSSTTVNLIPENVQKLWDEWDIRLTVLFSLFLQIVLISFSSFRKRTANKGIIILVWSAYLVADWVAAFALGLISNKKDDDSSSSTSKPYNEGLRAFWAPFLLLHLGGPDSITAFALEDNELWLRHLLGLVFQFSAAVYIFIRLLPSNRNWVATVIMFIAGLIKYLERSCALYLASVNSFRDSALKDPDPGPNYVKLMREYRSMKDAELPIEIEMITQPTEAATQDMNDESSTSPEGESSISHPELVRYAYEFFQTFKGLIVDLIFSFHDRDKSRDFFLKRNAQDAFKVIEVELSFVYEVLYTKAGVIHSWHGYFLRIICTCLTLVALILFVSSIKQGLEPTDIAVSYTLLIGAICLDFVAFALLMLSDWPAKHTRLNKFPIFNISRWSNSVSQFNLMSFCLSKAPILLDCFANSWGFKDFVNEYLHKSSQSVTAELKEFIFSELKKKAKIAKDPDTGKELCSARGNWILGRTIYHRLLGWSVHVEYDESILMWHIATELVFQTAEKPKEEKEEEEERERKFCKLLSDYMLYLLVMQPTLMSAVAGIGHIRYRDTCAEAKKYIGTADSDDSKKASAKLMSVDTEIRPALVKGGKSKSVLFDAVRLAKNLRALKPKKRWNIMCRVWLELLCYAASHCRAQGHAQQLSKGGELLTFIWLLMVHFGLGEQFLLGAEHGREKLIVGK
ncbi:hypothetical protein ACHQM5_025637 [Ranunculus cassubicifolius]